LPELRVPELRVREQCPRELAALPYAATVNFLTGLLVAFD
jgi:hypothetical protein